MARQETRLGKGLGALLGEYMDEEPDRGGERQVRVDRILPNPYQPRSDFEPESLGELVESIRENGLLQPLVVRPAGDEWELVAGERRWRALKELGWDRAPTIVRELDDDEMLVLALVENLQRENLSPIEEALGYQRLVETFELTHQQVADRVGRDRSTVTNTLRLLELHGIARDLLLEGKLTAGHARALLGLDDDDVQAELAEEVALRSLSVRTTERRVRALKARSRDEADEDEDEGDGRKDDPVARRAEQLLERALGTQVRVRLKGRDSGRIDIVFHDSDEFERLCGLLTGDEADALFD